MLFGRQSGLVRKDSARKGWFGKDSGRRPWRLSAKLLIASSIATVIGFSTICASVMLDMRRGEEELARQTLENLAIGIDADISRNIELYDLSLRNVASNLVMPEINGVSREIQHLILFDHAATARHFGAIQVFDAQGKLTHDAASLDPAPEDRSDEEYFQVHRANPDVGLYMSRPMLRRGAYSIVLSRRINDADGGFLGVVVGSIRFTYFHDLFGRLTLNPGDTITVLRRDRTIIMRTPFDLDVIGKNLAERSKWRANNLKEGTAYAGVGPVDPTPRLYVRSGSTSLFFVVVGKPLASILNLWHREVLRIGAIMMVLILFVVGTTLFLAREIGRRAEAEGTRDDRRADGAEEPAQIRYRDRSGVAAGSAQQDPGRGADDRCRPFQSLQRHLWTSSRRPGAGRHCDLHFGRGAAGRRLPGALRRRGIRGTAAGPLGRGSVHRRRNHPPEGRTVVGRSQCHDGQCRCGEHDAHGSHRLALSHRSGRQGALRGQGQWP